MEKSKHTPGPWEIAKLGRTDLIAVDGNDGMFICHLDRLGRKDEALANACLIAAAPALKEELIKDDKYICKLCKIVNPQYMSCNSCTEHDSRLSLIAKAEGE